MESGFFSDNRPEIMYDFRSLEIGLIYEKHIVSLANNKCMLNTLQHFYIIDNG